MLGLLFLIQLLKNIATFILDRDFSSTLPIIGFISLLLHAAVGLETGLYLSAIFLIIFLVLGLVDLLRLMKTYGLCIEFEASVNIGVIFLVTAWAFLTLIYLINIPY